MSNAQAASILSDERVEENDLIAGVYEGGFKTWEGGLDLAQFVALQLQRRQASAGQHQQPAAPQHEARQQQQQQLLQAEEAWQEQQWAAQLGPGSRVMELVSWLLGTCITLDCGVHVLRRGVHVDMQLFSVPAAASYPAGLCLMAPLETPACALQGCGHGLPGLVTLWAGAEVHFQVGLGSGTSKHIEVPIRLCMTCMCVAGKIDIDQSKDLHVLGS